ncbi:response regulator [Marinilabilia sp.]
MQKAKDFFDVMTCQHNILLIEDDARIASWISQKLNKLDNVGSLRWTSTLAESLEALDSQLPDIIILDLTLPDGNGTDVLKKIRNENLPVRVLVFSMNAGMRGVCRRLGAHAFFDKADEGEQLIRYVSMRNTE